MKTLFAALASVSLAGGRIEAGMVVGKYQIVKVKTIRKCKVVKRETLHAR